MIETVKKNALVLIMAMASACGQSHQAPVAEKHPKEFNEFGNVRVDNYYWLNDRKDPKVMAYLKEENEYFNQSFKKPNRKLIDKLYKEMKNRSVEDYTSVPYFENGYFYYIKYAKDNEYEIYCRKQNSLDSAEEILLDVNKLAEHLDYCDVDDITISPNNQTMAYSIDTVSRLRYEIRFWNISENRELGDVLCNTDGGIVFANDSRTTFYTTKETSTLRSSKVFRHIVGMDPNMDKEIYYEEDPEYELSVDKSKDDEWIFINHDNYTSNEVRLINAASPYRDPIVFRKREKDLQYYVDHCNGLFYIRTNENAKNFCIMTCDSTSYNNNWKLLVPHDENVLIQDFDVFDNYLVMEELRNGLVCFEIMDLKTKERKLMDFGQETYNAWSSYNPEHNTEMFRFGYCSLNTPKSTIDYNMATGEKTILKEDTVPGYCKDLYSVKRLMVKSRDGKEIPVSMIYSNSINLQGNNNLLLYAYGSYGLGEEDNFSQAVLSLVDRGFIYAIAHIRGGNEMGYQWYEDGKLMNKKNTFNDFIDVSKYLIDNNYTSPQKLYANGASAGGLLMGAVINMAPELYNGIVAEVPFVDVVTTMLDSSIPLTSGEWNEWGDPRQQGYYEYMLSYSPYDNVSAQDYPAMLVTTGLHDSQVQYWEPAKWVAKLRDTKTDNNPLYLNTNMKAGHQGDSGRFGQLNDYALTYAFILYLAGINE